MNKISPRFSKERSNKREKMRDEREKDQANQISCNMNYLNLSEFDVIMKMAYSRVIPQPLSVLYEFVVSFEASIHFHKISSHSNKSVILIGKKHWSRNMDS